MTSPSEDETPAILVDGLSKTYAAVRERSLRQTRIPWSDRGNRVGAAGGLDDDDDDDDNVPVDEEPDDEERPEDTATTVRALRDVSLTVPPGAALGVLGPAGSGKTTLLKVLAGITLPTSGRAVLRGRVAPLLEQASSLLNPDLSGRANAKLVARLFGVPVEVAERQTDAMFAFAGLEDKAGQRVWTYSSRQYRRLGFSIALHLEPDVVLADERLVGGDRDFAERAMQRLTELRAEGVTLLYASSDPDTVERFCPRSVWLEDGSIVDEGETAEVAERGRRRRRASRVHLAGATPELERVELEDAAEATGSDARLTPEAILEQLTRYVGVAHGERRLQKVVAHATRRAGSFPLGWEALAAAADLTRKQALGIAERMAALERPVAGPVKRQVFNEHVAILGSRLLSADGLVVETVARDETATVEIDLQCATIDASVTCGMLLVSAEVEPVRINQPAGFVVKAPGPHLARVELPAGSLAEAHYAVRITVRTAVDGRRSAVQRLDGFSFGVYGRADADLPDPDGDDLRPAVELATWEVFRRR